MSISSTLSVVDNLPNRSGMSEEDAEEFWRLMHGALNQMTRRYFFANCWHLNEDESAAFWRIYGDEEIAIQSTIGGLKGALPPTDWPRISIGEVAYTNDPERDKADKHGIEHFVLRKRNVYAYEREVRAFLSDMPPQPGDPNTLDHFDEVMEAVLTEDIPPGHSVPVDISVLIERVYVASGQPGWFEALVRSLLARYGHGEKPVERSGLNRRPEYWRDPVVMRDRFLMNQQQATASRARAGGR